MRMRDWKRKTILEDILIKVDGGRGKDIGLKIGWVLFSGSIRLTLVLCLQPRLEPTWKFQDYGSRKRRKRSVERARSVVIRVMKYREKNGMRIVGGVGMGMDGTREDRPGSFIRGLTRDCSGRRRSLKNVIKNVIKKIIFDGMFRERCFTILFESHIFIARALSFVVLSGLRVETTEASGTRRVIGHTRVVGLTKQTM